MRGTPPDTPHSGALRGVCTFAVVALLHVAAVFGPLWFVEWRNRVSPPKVNLFRVKLGGRELSSGPKVGRPERVPPRPEVRRKPAVAEPKVAVKPKPKPKVPKPKPRRAVAEPKVTVRKKTLPPKTRPRRPAVEPKVAVRKKIEKPKTRDLQSEVYQPPNVNPNVPVGSQNRWQRKADKPDSRTPGRVLDADLERYGSNVERYVYSRWAQPPRSLLGGKNPETLVELTVEPDGRVSGARIVTPSAVRAMETSVRALLSQLDLLPSPPGGRVKFQILLKTQ